MKNIIKGMVVISLMLIPNVSALTTDDVMYNDETVTCAIDDLYIELNKYKTEGNATAAQILSGVTAYVKGELVTGSMANNGATGVTDLAAGGSYTIPAGYTTGGTVTAKNLASQTGVDSGKGIAADKVLSGYQGWVNGTKITGSIGSVAGSTITPGTSAKTAVASGKYTTGEVKVAGDTNLVAGNIKTGLSIFGVSGTFTSDANATAAHILSGKTAYVNGSKITGNIGSVAGSTITPGTSAKQAVASGKYTTGEVKVAGDANLKAENIKCGVSIFGITGSNCSLWDKVSVGQYVSYTPEKTSYNIPTILTGYNSVQTIKPSELNLWRVIRKNADGSIDLVSHYISSTEVAFVGKEGYKSFIGTLNILARQYETEGITRGSRYMGYNGQTEFITDETMINKTTLPWTEDTSPTNSPKGSTREAQGGGDYLYISDLNLVRTALGTAKAAKVNATSAYYPYWGGSTLVRNGQR